MENRLKVGAIHSLKLLNIWIPREQEKDDVGKPLLTVVAPNTSSVRVH